MDITHLRQDYCKAGLNKNDLHDTPMAQFNHWFKQAHEAKINEPNAMCLSTISEQGHPHSRVVLLKKYDEHGFVFFTNYASQKANDIAHNPEVALLFTWLDLERQVRINGRAEKISTEASLAYFLSRPRGSQIGAWSSPQSQIIDSREILRANREAIDQQYHTQEIPLPKHWGGYLVAPHSFEFWQGRSSRLHDRFAFKKTKDGWQTNRLAP